MMNALQLAAIPAIAYGMISADEATSSFASSFARSEGVAPALLMPKLGEAGLEDGPDRSLRGARLEPSHGLDSAARGLTPESEWRAMFPRKPGT
jgi:hypothetical protein